jgi:hypothetical protein
MTAEVRQWPPVGTVVVYRDALWEVTGYLVVAAPYVQIKKVGAYGEGSIRLDAWDELTHSR